MGNKSSEGSGSVHNAYRIDFCRGICDAASSKSGSENIEPIMFSDMGSEYPGKVRAQINKVSSEKDIDESNNDLKVQGKPDELVVVRKAANTRQIETETDYHPIEVKYSVVKLCINEKVYRYLHQVDKNFDAEHSKANAKPWQLSTKGYYFKNIKQEEKIIITEDEFYQGFVKKGTFIPDKKGLLISQKGVYNGDIVGGIAEGKGKFIGQKFIIEGEWMEGKIKEGSYETFDFKYCGKFFDCKPSDGKITFKKSGVKYEGKFVNGKYDDLEAKYECDEYVYVGGFEAGLRHGNGQIKEKKGSRNRAPRRIKGKWRKDQLVNEKIDEV